MVHVREDRDVHRIWRQPRIPGEPENGRDASDAISREARPESIEVLGLDVGGVDGGARPEPTGDAHRVVAEAGPDVGHPLWWLNAEPIHHPLGLAVVISRLLVGILRGDDAGDRTVGCGKARDTETVLRRGGPREVNQQEGERRHHGPSAWPTRHCAGHGARPGGSDPGRLPGTCPSP